MSLPQSELVIEFGSIAPDAPEDTPVPFSVRREGIGESWDGGAFRCPLDERALGDVRWYLEEYGQWPFGPFRDRAHKIEARLEPWGRALFDALFAAGKPSRIYEHFLNEKADVRTLTLVSDAPRVMRLPWELLAESSGPLFTKRPPISIRRRVRLEHAPEVRQFALPLRVLFVTARPEEAGFVDPRSVAQGVLDALERLGGAVEVDFLRPPRWPRSMRLCGGRTRGRAAPTTSSISTATASTTPTPGWANWLSSTTTARSTRWTPTGWARC